jgi:hypothetical protein
MTTKRGGKVTTIKIIRVINVKKNLRIELDYGDIIKNAYL